MLCFPVEKMPDWRRPPIFTILLILVNTFCYFSFQLDDNEEYREVFAYYFDSGLKEIELPYYHRYVLDKHDPSTVLQVREAEQRMSKSDFEFMLFMLMQRDGVFLNKLEKGEIITSQNQQQSKWRYLRGMLEKRLDEVTSYRYGIKPNRPDLETLFTSMFLHGSFDHLLGNMIFLFLFGYIVEMATGWKIYLPAYLVAGIGSGLLYVLMEPGSAIPGIGASGAISGLSGMYTVLYGMRRVKFFIFLFVYFDTVRLPAIIMLPVWLAYEFYNHYFVDDGINNLAHAGGYISGALIIALLRLSRRKLNDEYINQETKSTDFNKRLAAAHQLLASLELDRARLEFIKLEKDFPDHLEIKRQLFNISKTRPDSEDFHRYAAHILSMTDTDAATAGIQKEVFNEYVTKARPSPRLKPAEMIRLAIRFAKHGYLDEADRIAAVIVKNKLTTAEVTDMLVTLVENMKKVKPERARQYHSVLSGMSAEKAADIEL